MVGHLRVCVLREVHHLRGEHLESILAGHLVGLLVDLAYGIVGFREPFPSVHRD